MTRPSRLAALLKALALILVATATYVEKVGPSENPLNWAPGLARIFSDHTAWIVWVSAISLLVIEIVEKFVARLTFRREKAVRLLDQMVVELFQNKPKDNCLSLLRASRGIVLIPRLMLRALVYRDQKLAALRSILLRPFGLYLFVWARSTSKDSNAHSCMTMRVYRNSSEKAEGIGGRVWERDGYQISALPKIEAADVQRVVQLDLLAQSDPIRVYANLSNIDDLAKLKARARFPRHYYGTVIEGPKSQYKWGVLLVDSVDSVCPWPTSNKGNGKRKLKDFEKDFSSFTLSLSIVLT